MLLNVIGCRLIYQGQAETYAEARFNIALRPRQPEGSLGRTAHDGHLDSHTAPELCDVGLPLVEFMYLAFTRMPGESYRNVIVSFLLCLVCAVTYFER